MKRGPRPEQRILSRVDLDRPSRIAASRTSSSLRSSAAFCVSGSSNFGGRPRRLCVPITKSRRRWSTVVAASVVDTGAALDKAVWVASLAIARLGIGFEVTASTSSETLNRSSWLFAPAALWVLLGCARDIRTSSFRTNIHPQARQHAPPPSSSGRKHGGSTVRDGHTQSTGRRTGSRDARLAPRSICRNRSFRGIPGIVVLDLVGVGAGLFQLCLHPIANDFRGALVLAGRIRSIQRIIADN